MPVAGIKHNFDCKNAEFWEAVAAGFSAMAAEISQDKLQKILDWNDKFNYFIGKLPEVS